MYCVRSRVGAVVKKAELPEALHQQSGPKIRGVVQSPQPKTSLVMLAMRSLTRLGGRLELRRVGAIVVQIFMFQSD